MPLLVKDRCIGVMDLESPNYDAFSKHDVELLTLLASQVAVAIENARLYEALRSNEDRHRARAAVRPARAGCAAAGRAPEAAAGRGRRGALRAGPRAGRRPPRLPVARSQQPGRRRRRRVGQGRAGGALQRVRGRAGPLAHVPPPLSCPSGSARRACSMSMNTILYERQLEGVLLHALLCVLRLQAPRADDGQFRAAVSAQEHRRRLPADRAARHPARARSRAWRTTRSSLEIGAGDVFVFCTDGIYETFNAADEEFGAERVAEIGADPSRRIGRS